MILASTLGLSTDEAQATEIACTQKIYSQLHDRDSMKRSIDVFHSFDTSKDGAITSSEFRAALHAMSLGLTEVECQYLIFRLDRNNDGWIAFSEFDNFVTESLGAYHEEIERLASGAEEGQKAARLQREREVRVLRDQRVALFHDWRQSLSKETFQSDSSAALRRAETRQFASAMARSVKSYFRQGPFRPTKAGRRGTGGGGGTMSGRGSLMQFHAVAPAV
jgi:hypothetical protein